MTKRMSWGVWALAVLLAPAAAQAKVKTGDRQCILPASGDDCARVLYAGQNIAVGEVLVHREGTDVTVTFKITNPEWTIVESHVYAAGTVPTTAAPGQFPYKHEAINTGLDVYVIEDAVAAATDCLYVATHAVVAKKVGEQAPDLDAFGLALPGTVTMSVATGGFGLPSYFDTTVTGGGELDGTYDGWCVDVGRTISTGQSYTAQVYSSYEDLPAGAVDKPENLDLVNWIINQDFSDGPYTSDQVQCAIWQLVDDNPGCTVDAGVAAIVAAAQAPENEGYEPQTCQDKVAVVLVPVGESGNVTSQVTIAQVTVIEVGDFCDDSYDPEQTETAWGCGDKTFRTGWGSYFTCGGNNCANPLPEVPAKLGRK
jgi:hypothetical protein